MPQLKVWPPGLGDWMQRDDVREVATPRPAAPSPDVCVTQPPPGGLQLWPKWITIDMCCVFRLDAHGNRFALGSCLLTGMEDIIEIN